MALNISSSTQPKGFTIDETPGSLANLGYLVKGNGDINGDGKKDFVVSAPGANGGTGELYVVFGGSDLTTSSPNTILLNPASSPYEISLSIGKINGDLYDDIIIGDPTLGQTYVVYGNTSGSIATDVTNLNGTNGFTIINSSGTNQLGFSVSSGNIDGDIYEDVIIGDPFNNQVYTVFGKPTASPFPAVFDISTANATDFLTVSGSPASNFGWSVSTGNIGGTSADDIIVGAVDGNGGNGEAYVVFGNNTHSSIANSTSALTGGNGFTLTTNSLEVLGRKVSSAGDINGDGYEDLIVSAELGSANGRNYVVYGNSSFTATLNTSAINGTNGFYIDGLNNDDFIYEAISAAGDINNDGIDDLLIAEPFTDTNGLTDSGQVYVVYGNQGGFGSNPKLDLSTLGINEGWTVNIPGLATNDFTGFSVSDAGDVNGDGVDDFLIGAPGTNGGDGTVYVALGQDTDKPIPETTVDFYPGYIYGGNNDFEKRLIGENHKFVVTFDNVASSPGNIGYSPFIDLFLDTTGVDGNDGFSFVGVKALSDSDFSIIKTGGVDGVHTLDYGPNIQTATILPGLFVNHPYAGIINVAGLLPPGIGVGDTLYVIPLLTDSFAPGQEPLKFEVEVNISDLADYNQPLAVATRGGFRYGANPVLDPVPTDPIFDDTATNDSLNPQLFRVWKNFSNGFDDNQIITGENFGGSYNIYVDVAPGQTVSTLAIQDDLPGDVLYLGTTSTNAIPPVTYIPPIPPPGGTVTASFGNVTGVDGVIDAYVSFDVEVGQFDKLSNPTLDPQTADDEYANNDAFVTAVSWTPLDPRDGTLTNLTEDQGDIDNTLTELALGINKTYSIVADNNATGLSPGDVIEYTLNFAVSDYFAFQNVKINDVFSDGQIIDTNFTPTFTVTEHGSTVSGIFTPPNYSVVNPGSNGTVNFDISGQLVTSGNSPVTDAQLLGGNVGGNFGATTGTIKFRTIIQEDFTTVFPSGDKSVDNGDYFSNNVTITGDVLDVNNLTPTGFAEADGDGVAFLLPRGKYDDYEVSVYAINGNIGSESNTVVAGDEVTYRIKYTLPFADIENLNFTSELPFPIFNVAAFTTNTVSPIPPISPGWTPPVNTISYGPMDTLQGFYTSLSPNIPPTGPKLTVDPQNNALKINYGTFDDPTTLSPSGNGSVTIDLLYTLKIDDQTTQNNLLLTNIVYEREGSTNAGSRLFYKKADLTLAQPELKITKSVVASSEVHAVFDPVISGTTFNSPGTTGSRFTTPITSSLLSQPIDSNLTGVQTGDLVTFAIILENTGKSPNGAFDVLIKDNLPSGFKIPTSSGLNLHAATGNGTTIAIDNTDPNDLFSSGIRLSDSAQGAIGAYSATSGNNIVVITFDLEVDSGVTNHQILTNVATLEEYSNKEGGAKFLPGTQSLTDDADVEICDYSSPVVLNPAINDLQTQFNAFLAPFPNGVGVANQIFPANPQRFTDDDLPCGDELTYTIIVEKSFGIGFRTINPGQNPFQNINAANLSFQFQANQNGGNLPNGLAGTYRITVQASDLNPSNNPGGGTFDVQDTFTFKIASGGTVTNNDIVGATVFFDANRNGELDANEPFTTTDAQGNFNFDSDLLIFDINGDGILDISEGQIVSLGGINTATGLVQDTALIASPDASVVTPLTTVIAELMGQGLTQTQANDLLTGAFSIPNTIDINYFDPIEAINNNQVGAVPGYIAHTQISILTSQTATIASHFSNASPSQILDNIVGAIANRIQSGLPLDLTNPTHLESIITNGAAIPSGNTSLVQGLAQIIAAANQSIEDFANTLPIASLEEQFAKVEKVALGETKQDIKDLLNGNKTIAQAIAENTGTALQNQINTALVFSADPTDISLTNTSVAESKPIGTTVGILSSVDSELGETHTYSLVRGEGDTDNNLFEIVGNTLKTKASFDYETKNSYNIRVQTSDGNGGIFWKEFTINVTDVNEIVEIVGTEKADTLFGTPGDDSIYGLGGNDTIYADEGDNIVDGGNGSDKIYAGNGDDVIDAGAGNDTIYANEGNNTIYGGAGVDTIYAGNGDDFIDAGDGNDTIYANEGDNTIYGGAGVDNIYAGNGDDFIDAGDGNDLIYANEGDNTIYGGAGIDTIYAGNGDDVIDAGAGNDTIYANEGNNTIDGGAGHDLIYAGNGDDIINGGLGNDTIYANGGDNIINGGLGNNTIWLGDGLDTVILELGSGFNTINNFQLEQTTFQLGSGLTTDDISIFNRTNGAEIYAGSDRLAVVSWTQASVIQNNLATIFV